MPSSHLILCHPLLPLSSIFPSIRVFSNESALHIRWPKYWSLSFNISPSNEHPGLTSFRMDWLDFLAVQGTLKSLHQHHSSKASILRHSAFFIVQLSHPYMTTGKTIALTRWTFVGKVMSLLFNMHTLLEHCTSCCPSRQPPLSTWCCQNPCNPGSCSTCTPALMGQTQVLQGSLRSKPQWTTHIQRWKYNTIETQGQCG